METAGSASTPPPPVQAAREPSPPQSPGREGEHSQTPGPAEGHRPTEINALLGRGTRFEGKLVFEGRVRIDGGFKGEIHGDDVLVIGEGAQVSGEVHVATCIVTGGEVTANIRARDGIELYAPAKVTGALHAPAIFIDRGVRFEGTCKMAPLDEDDARLSPPVAEAPATPRAGTLPGSISGGGEPANPRTEPDR